MLNSRRRRKYESTQEEREAIRSISASVSRSSLDASPTSFRKTPWTASASPRAL